MKTRHHGNVLEEFQICYNQNEELNTWGMEFMGNNQSKTVDEYISRFPDDIRDILEKLRRVIKEAAPRAEETINYGIPTFKLNGNLVHFAAFKKHVGFYPTPSAVEAFTEELSPYETSKGTVKFPVGKPIPLDLIKMIVKFRVNEVAGE